MAENKGRQRLHLSKGADDDNNIYIDTSCLPQHQYDGIRFLYRQFKKGKAGVILNDPPGYGKRVQTVLFLNAMCPITTLPTLILCTEGNEEVWTQQFRQWTNMGSDVSVQKGNKYTKSMCVIGTISQIYVLCRREWGILVVDDTNVSREALRAAISAQYRIWLTSLDMKKHLQTFSLIFKWLYPKDKFVVEDFETVKNPTALLSKTVRLDAFMEDIVFRRRDIAVPLGKRCLTPDQQRVSRKNKDATGKKIKRSKCLPDDGHNTSNKSQETGSEHDISVKSAKNGEVDGKKESTEDFIVNITNKEDTKRDENDTDDKRIDNTSNRHNKVTNDSILKSGDNNEVEDKTHEMDIDFNTDDKEIPKSDSVPKSDTQDDILTLLNSDIDSQNLVIKYDSETQDSAIENDILTKKSKITNEVNVSEDLFSTDIVPSDNKSDEVNNHDTNAKANDQKHNKNTFSEDSPTIEVNDENKDELVRKNIVSENNKTDPQLSGIDLQIKQMEELAMKKFKGSFLDRMLN